MTMLHRFDAEQAAETAAPCPCCGAYAGQTLQSQASALLAVCDVLVVRALEQVGKRIVRSERARFRSLGTRPWHLAHTLWRPDEEMVRRALRGSWDVIPALLDHHGCCGVTVRQVTDMIDSYVRDLLITGTPHSVAELHYRFETFLGVPLDLPEPYSPDRTATGA